MTDPQAWLLLLGTLALCALHLVAGVRIGEARERRRAERAHREAQRRKMELALLPLPGIKGSRLAYRSADHPVTPPKMSDRGEPASLGKCYGMLAQMAQRELAGRAIREERERVVPQALILMEREGLPYADAYEKCGGYQGDWTHQPPAPRPPSRDYQTPRQPSTYKIDRLA